MAHRSGSPMVTQMTDNPQTTSGTLDEFEAADTIEIVHSREPLVVAYIGNHHVLLSDGKLRPVRPGDLEIDI